MSFDKEKIIEALKGVIDPSSGNDIISMNMIKDLKIDGNNVNFSIVLPRADVANKEELNFACINAINEIYITANVNIHLAIADPFDFGSANNALPHVKNIIAVASGKGGVGKSTISVNLALSLKEMGYKVGLIDADLYGPSMPTMLGLKDARPEIRDVYGKQMIVPLEAYGIQVMSIGFVIEPEQAVVLRGPKLSGILGQFINDCIWDELDFMVIDLPPGTGDIQLTLVQTVPVTGAVMVTTPQDVAVADALKAMNMLSMNDINVPVLGVVENMSWFTPEELPDNKYYLFGQGGGEELAKLGNTKLLAQIPLVQGIGKAGDLGKPIVLHKEPLTSKYFRELASNVVEAVIERNKNLDPTKKVEITT